MCSKSHCVGCIPVKKACLAVAIISATVTLLSLLASITVGVMLACGAIAMNSEGYYSSDTDVFLMFMFLAFSVMLGIGALINGIASLIGFIFSVLLCNGICKRKPGQVKAYFIYGVVVTFLAGAAGVALLFTEDPMIGVYTLVACVIHSLYLVLVQKTYLKLLEEDPTKEGDQEYLTNAMEIGEPTYFKPVNKF